MGVVHNKKIVIDEVANKLGKPKNYVKNKLRLKEAEFQNCFDTIDESFKYICGKRILECIKKEFNINRDKDEIQRQLADKLLQIGLPLDFEFIINEIVLIEKCTEPR